ncbi:hypothetical protein GG681_02945 [Epibacterium sp. SM1969]|uniref:Uncharacterized protein n=1 Tax=Tritonibacter aquimaris TaxID=2663379 RepID=A0A844AT72_9RHOB|nr:hypothetical protein [Tritonibacter aquimaris]MQY41584.1 hypothetical protein [Tritonibacter aquimaris]
MEHIEELQARILAAMERISSGVTTLEAAGASSAGGNADLERALDEERTANAQLEERLKVLRGRLDEAELAAENASGGGADPAAMEALEAEVQLLRNEVGNTAERDALRLEVDRLKGALEGAQNEAASSKEHCETMETENTRLKSELEAAMLAAEVDVDALNAEIAKLTSDLDAERQAATQAAEAAADAAQQQAAQHATELTAAQAAAQDAIQAAANTQPAISEVDFAALEAENTRLKSELQLAQQPVDDSAELIKLDQELGNLRAANDQLVSSNAALRAANAEGVGDPALINASLQAEIEGLRAAKETDRAEMSMVISRLEPLLATAQNLPQGEDE